MKKLKRSSKDVKILKFIKIPLKKLVLLKICMVGEWSKEVDW